MFTKIRHKKTKQYDQTNRFYTLIIASISIFVRTLSLVLIFVDMQKNHVDSMNTIANYLEKNKNPSIVPLLWLFDNGIIWDVSFGCESENIDQGRSYVNKSINISHCFFSRFSIYSGDGGVIYANGESYSMNINYSMFYNCVCSSCGGAIYFYSSNSSLKMICANGNSAFSDHFAFIKASQLIQVELLSLSNSSYSTSHLESIFLFSNKLRVDNTNSSMNNAYQSSGIFFETQSTSTSSYCTFSNNNVSHGICIGFCPSLGIISMSYANIVHNYSPSLGIVSVFGPESTRMMYCIFQNNHDSLFCVNQGFLEVVHSFISHSGSFSRFLSVLTSNNNSFANRITYQIEFFYSYYCNASITLPTVSSQDFQQGSLSEQWIIICIVLTIGFIFSIYLFRNKLPFMNHSESSLSTDNEDFLWKSSV